MSKKSIVQITFIIALFQSLISSNFSIVKDLSKFVIQENFDVNLFINSSFLKSMVTQRGISILVVLITIFFLWHFFKKEIKRLDREIKNYSRIIVVGVGVLLMINSIASLGFVVNSTLNLLVSNVPENVYLPLLQSNAIEIVCFVLQMLFGLSLVIKSKFQNQTILVTSAEENCQQSTSEEL